jgi:hypothetical protein
MVVLGVEFILDKPNNWAASRQLQASGKVHRFDKD